MDPSPGKSFPTGQAAQPVLVTSFTEYQRTFGGFVADSFLPYAAKVFFDNGGQRLYIVRVLRPGATTAWQGSISALNEGAWGNNIWVAFAHSSDYYFAAQPLPTPTSFKLIVMYGATSDQAMRNVVETFDQVTVLRSRVRAMSRRSTMALITARIAHSRIASSSRTSARPRHSRRGPRIRARVSSEFQMPRRLQLAVNK